MKKFICLVLVVAMALSMGITSAFADGEQGSATLAVEDATGYAGELVSVKVDLTANDGVYGMLLPISCTGPITLESYSSGAFTGWTVAKNAVWYNDIEANNDTTGTIITLNFRVDDDAAVGATATVIVGTDAQALDKDLNNVAVNAASATVTIAEKPVETPITEDEIKSVSLSASLVLDGIISIKYVASGSVALDDPRVSLLVWNAEDYANNCGSNKANCTVENNPTWKYKFTKNGDSYEVTGDGIPAKDMASRLQYRLCVENSDGTVYYQNVANNYTPQSYCYSVHTKQAGTTQDALCVAIMDYGAAAQTYFLDTPADQLMNVLFH